MEEQLPLAQAVLTNSENEEKADTQNRIDTAKEATENTIKTLMEKRAKLVEKDLKSQLTPETKPGLKPEIMPEKPKPEIKPEVAPETPKQPEVKPEKAPKTPEKPELKPEPMPKVPELKPESMPKVPELKPESMPKVPELKPESMPKVPELKPESMPKVPELKPEPKPEVDSEETLDSQKLQFYKRKLMELKDGITAGLEERSKKEVTYSKNEFWDNYEYAKKEVEKILKEIEGILKMDNKDIGVYRELLEDTRICLNELDDAIDGLENPNAYPLDWSEQNLNSSKTAEELKEDLQKIEEQLKQLLAKNFDKKSYNGEEVYEEYEECKKEAEESIKDIEKALKDSVDDDIEFYMTLLSKFSYCKNDLERVMKELEDEVSDENLSEEPQENDNENIMNDQPGESGNIEKQPEMNPEVTPETKSEMEPKKDLEEIKPESIPYPSIDDLKEELKEIGEQLKKLVSRNFEKKIYGTQQSYNEYEKFKEEAEKGIKNIEDALQNGLGNDVKPYVELINKSFSHKDNLEGAIKQLKPGLLEEPLENDNENIMNDQPGDSEENDKNIMSDQPGNESEESNNAELTSKQKFEKAKEELKKLLNEDDESKYKKNNKWEDYTRLKQWGKEFLGGAEQQLEAQNNSDNAYVGLLEDITAFKGYLEEVIAELESVEK